MFHTIHDPLPFTFHLHKGIFLSLAYNRSYKQFASCKDYILSYIDGWLYYLDVSITTVEIVFMIHNHLKKGP